MADRLRTRPLAFLSVTTAGERRIEIVVNGEVVVVEDESATLLDVLRGQVGTTLGVKDGCSPKVSAGVAPCWSTDSRGS